MAVGGWRHLRLDAQGELDHIQPKGLGGPSTVENSRLACQFHNQYAARLTYGGEWMDRFARSRRSEAEGAVRAGP